MSLTKYELFEIYKPQIEVVLKSIAEKIGAKESCELLNDLKGKYLKRYEKHVNQSRKKSLKIEVIAIALERE